MKKPMKYDGTRRVEMDSEEVEELQATFAGRSPPDLSNMKNPLQLKMDDLEVRLAAAEAKLSKSAGVK